ncbi:MULTISPECIES: SDR family NAD(P)-dependent oxidoreductase [Amycolatopsis]|uniref:NAD(P)-dependent dehydrogenase, short-chain alcohol dehydrogenase family n=2 Tax=Amycolatopsis TaxID=1813 RepID=A0A1I3WPH6_9PSEU|nr:SDR family NAD(P)-dependent oxidoreductase [Amycolatopsis sacchari]SFK09574.1 NAD(P)-dependent dehydrogenase, short-chain alcohol dehydrogenase family [Amycolatopsis sacchari]
MEIANSVVLVTGGSSGLGLATVRRFHHAGATVVLVGRPSSNGKVVADGFGDRVVFAAADVTDETQVAQALEVAADLGPLRTVVTCAGVLGSARVLGRRGPASLEDFAETVRTNLIGTFNVVRLAAERIAAVPCVGEERGVIVCTASIAAYDGQVGQAAYGASKAGVAAMTLPLARELAAHAIRVNTIAPGVFDTPMIKALPEGSRRALAAHSPHPGRLGRPEEFAALVAHVVENPMLNGEVIRLDGAVRMPSR